MDLTSFSSRPPLNNDTSSAPSSDAPGQAGARINANIRSGEQAGLRLTAAPLTFSVAAPQTAQFSQATATLGGYDGSGPKMRDFTAKVGFQAPTVDDFSRGMSPQRHYPSPAPGFKPLWQAYTALGNYFKSMFGGHRPGHGQHPGWGGGAPWHPAHPVRPGFCNPGVFPLPPPDPQYGQPGIFPPPRPDPQYGQPGIFPPPRPDPQYGQPGIFPPPRPDPQWCLPGIFPPPQCRPEHAPYHPWGRPNQFSKQTDAQIAKTLQNNFATFSDPNNPGYVSSQSLQSVASRRFPSGNAAHDRNTLLAREYLLRPTLLALSDRNMYTGSKDGLIGRQNLDIAIRNSKGNSNVFYGKYQDHQARFA